MSLNKKLHTILISLPEEYDYIINAAIEESKDTSNFSVEELMGSLRAQNKENKSILISLWIVLSEKN